MIYNLIVGSSTTLEDLNRSLRFARLVFEEGDIWTEEHIETRWENKTLIITSTIEIPYPERIRNLTAIEYYADQTSSFLSRIYINPPLKIYKVEKYVLITKISDKREVKLDLFPLFSGLEFDKSLIDDKRESPYKSLTIRETKERFERYYYGSDVTNNDLDLYYQKNKPTHFDGLHLRNKDMIASYNPYPRYIIKDTSSEVMYDFVNQKVYAVNELSNGNIGITVGVYDDLETIDTTSGRGSVEVTLGAGDRKLITSRFYPKGRELYTLDHKLIGVMDDPQVKHVLHQSEILSFKGNQLYNCSLTPIYEQLDTRILAHKLGKDYRLVDICNGFFIFGDRRETLRLVINGFNNYRVFSKNNYDTLKFLDQSVILRVNDDMVDYFDIDNPNFDQMYILEKKQLVEKLGHSDPFTHSRLKENQSIKNPVVVGHRLYLQTGDELNGKIKLELL